MNKLWRIELLGWLRAIHRDRVVSRFQTQKTGALLGFLAFHCHRSHPREALIELLWPADELAAGRNKLRLALASLRRQLEPPGVPRGAVIMADRATVQLNPAAISTDVADFEAACTVALPTGGGADCPLPLSTDQALRLGTAVELYRGELLPGCAEEWVLRERGRLGELYGQALAQLIGYHEQSGTVEQALQYARRAVAADPLRDQGWHDLIHLLAAAGEPRAALAEYQALEQLLEQELGVEPPEEIQRLVERLQSGASVSPVNGRERVAVAAAPRRETPSAAAPTLNPMPTGTVTFLLTDIEDSTALLNGEEATLFEALAAHHALLREQFARFGGWEVRERANAFLVAFASAGDALGCAVAGQQALAAHPWSESVVPLRIQMALHTGDVERREGEYRGPTLPHAERMLAAAHGGQILCSEATAGLLLPILEAGVQLVDLGIYRLRDPARPERLYQVEYPGMTQTEFPPLNAEAGHAGRLPLQFTRFFGRAPEIDQLRELLLVQQARLVTLTGPGGSGKTRLAVELATRLQKPFAGALWFVPLADVRDPQLIGHEILDVLRLPRSPHLEPLEQVITFLASSQPLKGCPALVLLDNFEQLLPEGLAIVRQMLERVPTLTVLVTSRQRLGLAGEQEFPVGPLPVPGVPVFRYSGVQADPSESLNARTPEYLISCPSVQLFVDRAQAVRPDFQVTPANAAALAAVCERLEGIPLAIELAAARSLVLAPAQMLARLEQRFELLTRRHRDTTPRHRSLRAALDWSFELLAPELQRFFAQLSVFRGGWTLEAAETVCGDVALGAGRQALADPTVQPGVQRPAPVLDYLEQLRQSSLVLVEEAAGEMRYRLLETLREYGAEQLAPEVQVALSRRHAWFFLGLAERAEPEMHGPKAAAWLERLALEEDNLRAALAWSQSEEEAREVGLRLAGALVRFWLQRGSYTEGRQWAETALRRVTDAEPVLRGRLLGGVGDLALNQGDFEGARQLYEERLRLLRQLGDREGTAGALTCLGRVALNQGQLRHARSVLRESLSIRKVTGDNTGAAESQRWLGEVASNLGDFGAAHLAFEETLDILRKYDDTSDRAIRVNFSMGRNAREVGDYARAQACFEQSLKISRTTGDKGNIAAALLRLGDVANTQGRYEQAFPLLQQSLVMLREIEDQPGLAASLNELGRMAVDRGDYALARSYAEQSLAIFRELGNRWAIPYALYTLGMAARYQCEYDLARAAHEESAALARETGHPWALAYALQSLGLVAEAQGKYEQSQSLIEQSLCIWRRLENKLCTAMALRELAYVAQKAGNYPRAQSLFRESLTLFYEMGHNRGVPRALTGCASLALAEGQAERAARLLGAAEKLQEVIDAPMPPPQRQSYEQTAVETKSVLDDKCFAVRWSEGRGLTLEEILASLPSR